MKKMIHSACYAFKRELPVIRIYLWLFLFGIMIGIVTVFLLKNRYSLDEALIDCFGQSVPYVSVFLSQLLFFLILILLGFTIIGVVVLPLFPVYNGFSLGLMLTFSVILFGIKGLVYGFVAFVPSYLIQLCVGFFCCYSSASFSIGLIHLLSGKNKHISMNYSFIKHLSLSFFIVPFLGISAFLECLMPSVFYKIIF